MQSAVVNGNQEPKKRAISSVEVFEEISPGEFKEIYDRVNGLPNKKCGASTLFQRTDGKYDAFLYVTTFVPIGSALDPVV